jgi:uncharacterized protein YidB (DUF937 family)
MMARGGFPSMTALLGLLAVAGFKNRDKISEMLAERGASASHAGNGGVSGDGSAGRPARESGMDGLLGDFLGETGLDRLLGGGLSELSERFGRSGRSDTVKSWVGSGPNRNIAPRDLEEALGPEALDDLSERTGLPREEVLARLSRDLPDAVDRYTPEGRMPGPVSSI